MHVAANDPLRAAVLASIRSAARRSGVKTERRRELVGQLERLRDLYVMGDLSKGEYVLRRQALEEELARTGPPRDARLDKAEELLADFSRIWELEHEAGKRARLVATLFDRVWQDGGTIVAVKPREPFLRYFQTADELAKRRTNRRGVESGSDGLDSLWFRVDGAVYPGSPRTGRRGACRSEASELAEQLVLEPLVAEGGAAGSVDGERAPFRLCADCRPEASRLGRSFLGVPVIASERVGRHGCRGREIDPVRIELRGRESSRKENGQILDQMKGMRGDVISQIEHVYETRYPHFLRLARGIVGDTAAADVVQEAFASAVKSRDTFRGDATLETWIWKIVITTALREHRNSRREPWSDRDVDDASRWRDDDDSAVARALIAGLPERQRLVLFLRYYADLDYRAIANVLDIEIGTVGASLSAARHDAADRAGHLGCVRGELGHRVRGGRPRLLVGAGGSDRGHAAGPLAGDASVPGSSMPRGAGVSPRFGSRSPPPPDSL